MGVFIMSMGPIEMQASINRSLEINRMAYDEAERNEAFKQHFKLKLQEEAKKEQDAVLELSKDMIVNKDGRNKQPHQRDKKNKEKENKNKKRPLGSTSMLDLRV